MARNVPEIIGQGEYTIVNVNGYNYFSATETGDSFPRGYGRITVSRLENDEKGQPILTYVGDYYEPTDALIATVADSNQREAHARLQEALMPKEACYSDHNHDIDVKGTCDYCRGTEKTRD